MSLFMKILILAAIVFALYKFVLPAFYGAQNAINENNRTLLNETALDSNYDGSDRQKALGIVKENK